MPDRCGQAAEHREQIRGIRSRSGLEIVGIDGGVVIIVDPFRKLLQRPCREIRSETKPTMSAKGVIDWNSGKAKVFSPGLFARLIEIHHVQEWAISTANRA